MYFRDRDRVFEFIRNHKNEICFPEKVNWTYTYKKDEQWGREKQDYYLSAVQAYVATGEQKYLQEVFNQIEEWIDVQDELGEKVYTTENLGIQLKIWVKVLEYMENTGTISDRLWKKIEKSMHAQTEYLMKSYKKAAVLTDRGVREFHGTFLASVYFSNWDEAEEWVRKSVEILEKSIQLQVTNDGFHWKQSYIYHIKMLKCLSEVIWIADHRKINISEMSRKIIKKMADAIVHMITPMGMQSCCDDNVAVEVSEILGGMYLIFGDETFKYFAPKEPTLNLVCDYGAEAIDRWNETAGKAPEQLDYEHSDVGRCFIRTGWREDNSYLFFKNGFIGSGERHYDLLHVGIISKGNPILTDFGQYPYRADTLTCQEVQVAKAHNTFLVDEEKPVLQDNSYNHMKQVTAIRRPVLLNKEICYLQGAYICYMTEGVFINRKVIYIKPNIWIITDESFAKMTHTYQQYFHFTSSSLIAGGREIVYADEKQVFRMRVMQKSEICLEEMKIPLGCDTSHSSKCVVVTKRARGDTSMTVICVAEAVRKQHKIEEIPVRNIRREIIPPEYVHG